MSKKEHLLQNRWCLYFDAQSSKTSEVEFNNGLRQVSVIRTVEDFWRTFNGIPELSSIKDKANYHLFKAGIRPSWEDPANEKGGRWLFGLERLDKSAEEVWEEVALSLIGEVLDVDDEITGAVFSRRDPRARIAIWTRNSQNLTQRNEIKERLINLPAMKKQNNYRLRYEFHPPANALTN
eukprot:TRINITY_DN2350_c0_g2_i1.p1 TRINITY_DN2350_c0_g2~~TRINITY_DN2350_c0_g2_i1.p1  ORF type:complete len:180 (-),score=25.63 TRINITY_DN2350_c0_g2_i1:104-643(-)